MQSWQLNLLVALAALYVVVAPPFFFILGAVIYRAGRLNAPLLPRYRGGQSAAVAEPAGAVPRRPHVPLP